jgi:DNA repair protein RecO (recombination protein O)
MVVKTRGIVLRTVKYGETSIIADIYTEGFGVRSYIVSGVRTSKAKVSAGLLQVMSLVDIVAYDKVEKLNRIKEIRAAHVYTRLPFEMGRASVGLFMAEVTKRVIRESEENADLFDFLFSAFRYLDETEHSFANIHLVFLLELSGYLGFRPHEEDYTEGSVFDLKNGYFTKGIIGHSHFLNDKQASLLRGLLSVSWHDSHTIAISRSERRLLIGDLLKFYQFHLDNFPEIQSFKILQEIL